MPFPDVHQGPVYATNRESPTKPLSTLSPKNMNEMERNTKNRGHSRATSTATAAIERSKLGQEEAVEKARHYKSLLLKQVEKYEHQLERYEDLQHLYKKAQETNADTTKRLRKETFKCQSMIVKLQQEIKTARNTVKIEDRLRATQCDEGAFTPETHLMIVRRRLWETEDKLEMARKEIDALKSIVKGKEIIKIASEGRIPLPSPEDELDENEKEDVTNKRPDQVKDDKGIETTVAVTSLAVEEELGQIRMELEWAKRSAKRAHDLVDFMKVECQFRRCSCRIENAKSSPPEEVIVAVTQPSPEPVAPEANFSLLSLIEEPTTAAEMEVPIISPGSDVLAPTMSREEALEQIKQRRVRSIQV